MWWDRFADPPYGDCVIALWGRLLYLGLMAEYRRLRIPGGCYFFTVTLADRRSSLLVEQIDLLRRAVARTRRSLPFEIDACVVLPEHLHAIWTLPEGDDDFSARWRLIKLLFSQDIARGETISTSRKNQGERGIWQRRFWEHAIRDERDYAAHFDYVHFNPVKHGLVGHVADWPYSTFHRCVARGLYPPDWGKDIKDGDFGEPILA